MIQINRNGSRPEECTGKQPYKTFRRALEGEWELVDYKDWCRPCYMYLYHAYLRSDRWKSKKNAELWDARGKCRFCGSSATDVWVQGHHINYDHIGHERPEDITAVCDECHETQEKKDEYRDAAQRVERARTDFAHRIVPDHSRYLVTKTVRGLVHEDGETYGLMSELAGLLDFMFAKYNLLYYDYAESNGADRDNPEHCESISAAVLGELWYPLKKLGFDVTYRDTGSGVSQPVVSDDVTWDDLLYAPTEAVGKWQRVIEDRLLSADVIEYVEIEDIERDTS